MNCIAHKTEHGTVLRCTRAYGHKGRHRWGRDEGFYPFGRLDPGDPLDQAFVEAFNRGAAKHGAQPCHTRTRTKRPNTASRV